MGGVYRGGEAVVQNVFGPISQDVEGFAATPEEFMTAGDTVAVVVSLTGTGKQLDLPVVHVWDIQDTPGPRVAKRFTATSGATARLESPPIRIHEAENEAAEHGQDEQDRECLPESLGRIQSHPVIKQPEKEAEGG
jgi:hypothetical protein